MLNMTYAIVIKGHICSSSTPTHFGMVFVAALVLDCGTKELTNTDNDQYDEWYLKGNFLILEKASPLQCRAGMPPRIGTN